MRLVNIGYGNVVVAERVVAVISPDSAPMKRFKDEARKAGRLIDGTQGRRTRSILITDSHHIVLSALQTETVAERLARGAYVPSPNQPSAAPPPVEEPGEPPYDAEAEGEGEAGEVEASEVEASGEGEAERATEPGEPPDGKPPDGDGQAS